MMVGLTIFFSMYTSRASQSLSLQAEELLTSSPSETEQLQNHIHAMAKEWKKSKVIIAFSIENQHIDEIDETLATIAGMVQSSEQKKDDNEGIISEQLAGEIKKLSALFSHLHETERLSIEGLF